MANSINDKWKAALLGGAANSALNGTVKVALIDTGVYTYDPAHEFLSDLAGRIGTDQTLGSKTFVDGTFDAANATFAAVTGNTVEALVIYIDTGAAATSRLVNFIDTGITGLPVTPNGGNIVVEWDAAGIFRLGA